MGRKERTEDYKDLVGFMLEEVDSFRYLRSIVNGSNAIRAGSCNQNCSSIKMQLVNDVTKSKSVSRTTKLRINTSVIRPVGLLWECVSYAVAQ